MISWAHDGEAMSPPVACHSVFAGFTVHRSPINSPPEFFIKFPLSDLLWELELAKPRALRGAASLWPRALAMPPYGHAPWLGPAPSRRRKAKILYKNSGESL